MGLKSTLVLWKLGYAFARSKAHRASANRLPRAIWRWLNKLKLEHCADVHRLLL